MSLSKEDYITRLENSIKDVAEFLEPDDKYRFLGQAVGVYSKDRARIKVHELTGDGSAFDFDVPDDWAEDFSFIKHGIEYPYDPDLYQTPQYLLDDSWVLYRKLVDTVTTLFIRFLTFTPTNGIKAKFEYALPHTLDDTTNTINDADAEAVVNLAAAFCFWALAAKFAQSSEPTLDADVIDYQRKVDLYTDLAKDKLSYYRAHLGIGEEAKTRVAAAAGISVKDFDLRYPGGSDYLTHPSVFR